MWSYGLLLEKKLAHSVSCVNCYPVKGRKCGVTAFYWKINWRIQCCSVSFAYLSERRHTKLSRLLDPEGQSPPNRGFGHERPWEPSHTTCTQLIGQLTDLTLAGEGISPLSRPLEPSQTTCTQLIGQLTDLSLGGDVFNTRASYLTSILKTLLCYCTLCFQLFVIDNKDLLPHSHMLIYAIYAIYYMGIFAAATSSRLG